VWVDYITVNSNNTTSGNTWTRAAVSSAAASPTATISYDGANRLGFWLQGNSGSYSATVTVQLNITASKFNWCAYVSDYPPNVTANNSTYTFKGTPPFTLIAANGTTTQTVSGKTLTASSLTITPTIIKDKTECPGDFCIYKGSDLYIDATHLCRQLTSGAMNWEAYIKDSRDSRIYRITQFSNGSWWFAEDLATTLKRKDYCSDLSWYAAQDQPACPTGWSIPTFALFTARWPTGSSGTDNYSGALMYTNAYSGYECYGNGNYHCFANNEWVDHYIVGDLNNGINRPWHSTAWYCYCGGVVPNNCDLGNNTSLWGRVRCFRQN
jgi:hypothetical protein